MIESAPTLWQSVQHLKTPGDFADAAFAHAVTRWPDNYVGTVDELVRLHALLIHEEVSELGHTVREPGGPNAPCDKAHDMEFYGLPQLTKAQEECADILLRTLGLTARLGMDPLFCMRVKHAFNMRRAHVDSPAPSPQALMDAA